MDRLALIGVSQRRGGLEALEAWTAWVQNHAHTLSLGASSVSELVPITTCNRCDLVLVLSEGKTLDQARAELMPPGSTRGYAYASEAALEQLCRVASSLDSLNPGEDQIMNQVRQAFEDARQAGSVGPTTSFAFNTALRIAKRVRREVPLAPANTSLFSLARAEFESHLPARAKVAVVGAGEMGSLAARSLASRPGTELFIVNRSLDKAQSLAREVGAVAVGLEAFLQQAPPLHGLVTATPVEHLITGAFLDRQPSLKVITDLGLPRNVEPALAKRHRVTLIDQERMRVLGEHRRESLRANLARAEAIIAEELEIALGDWAERMLGPAITHLREVYRSTIERAVGELLSPEDVNRLAHRFAHLPVKGLRGLARERGIEAAKIFLDEAGLSEASTQAAEEKVVHG